MNEDISSVTSTGKEKGISSNNIVKRKIKIRNIRCYCIESKIELVFKQLERDKMHLRILEQMVHMKICLEDIDDLVFLWTSGHGVPWTLKMIMPFFGFGRML